MEKLMKLLESTEHDTDTIVSTLGLAYEQLKLKHVPVPANIQVKIEQKLLEQHFITKTTKPTDDEFILFKNVKDHLNFTCAMIDQLLSKYLGKEFEIDLEFDFRASYIAQSMSVLKRRLDYTYDILPWEEMQFCLVIYLYSLTKHSHTDIIYKLVLDKKRILNHLFLFYEQLKKVQENFKKENLQLKKNVKRNVIKDNILKQSPVFQQLYEDFSILRDVYSLTKIGTYLEQALSIDITENNIVGKLVIERTLQVMGEYFKNTVDSPNLSADLHKLSMKSVPRNLRSILPNVRNMLSHAFSLNRKLELESSQDIHFFKNVQKDLKKLHVEILFILYQQKINAIKMFLIKILNQHTLGDIQCIFGQVDIQEIKINTEYDLNSEDFSKVTELIYLFCLKVSEESNEDTDLINVVKGEIECYKSKINAAPSIFKEGIDKLLKLQQNKKHLTTLHNMARTYLVTFAASDSQSLFKKVFQTLYNIYDNFKRRRNYDVFNFLETDKKVIELADIIIEIYNHLKWGMRKIKWIEKIEETLTVKIDIEQEKIKKISDILKAVEKNLERHEDKSTLQDAIIQKIELHSNKSKIINAFEMDEETFACILKSFNLSAKRQRLYNFETQKFDRLQLLVKQINDDYGTLIKQLGDIFPLNKYLNSLKTFYNSLKLKKPLQVKVMKAINDAVQEEMIHAYGKRLEVLKNLKQRMDFQELSENKYLVTAIEMLVLDLTEFLGNVKLLGDNKSFLIESLPILKGKQLRNYLAHGDILTDILPYNPKNSIIFHAKKLVDLGEGILSQNNILLGHKINHDNINLQEYFVECLNTVKTQELLFDIIKNNDNCKVAEIISNGAELEGTSLNGLTVLDFAIYAGSLELFKFFLRSKTEPTDTIYNYLRTAVMSGKFAIMEYIVTEFKANINFKYENDITLLHIALKYGHTLIAEYLIKNNANIYDKTANNKTTLLFALESGTTELVRSLLDMNADLINVCTNNNTTALHIAIQNNDFDIVQFLLSKNANPSIKTKDGFTAFEQAAQYGHKDILTIFLGTSTSNLSSEQLIRLAFVAAASGCLNAIWLLIQNSFNINSKNSDGQTVLHLAAFYGYEKDVILLIENKININCSDNNGRKALHIACQYGHTEVINILLENEADINAEDNKKWTSLHWATQNGHQNVVKLLLCKNGNDKIYDENGNTALHLAAEICSSDIFNILLEYTGDANIKTARGQSALHLAAENGHGNIINVLLNTSHVDVNVKTENDETALILAATNGHYLVVEQLLKHGAHVNHKSKKEGYSALTRAAEQGYTDIVATLIKNNADIELQEETSLRRALHYTVHNGYTDVLDILLKNGVDVNAKYANNGTALLTAIRNGHIDIVQKLIKFGADIHAMVLFLTPLRVAAHFGYKDIVLMLLKHGANINESGSDYVTPLHSAAWNGHVEVVDVLLKNGANINSREEDQWTALHVAAQDGHYDVVTFLIENGADINSRTEDQRTALHLAAQNEHYDIVTLLIENGADINSKTNLSENAFHIACDNGHCDIVTILLRHKVNVDEKNIYGLTGLFWAAANGHNNIVAILIQHNATVNIKANNGSTPLHWAVQYAGSIDVVNNLIKHNADVNVIDARGLTPLYLASLNGYKTIVEVLLQNNANVNVQIENITALHLVAGSGHLEITKMLLEKGAKVNDRGLYKKTGLHLAAEEGHTEIVHILLEKGAEINVRDEFAMTPLHLATEEGHEDIVKLLLKSNSQINTKNNNGYTPLHSAIANSHENIAVLLIAQNADMETKTYDELIIHHAVKNGMINLVSALIHQGVNVHVDFNNVTSLMESLHNGHEDIAVLLIKNNAKINKATSREWTPLHVAAERGYKKVVSHLLGAKADINAKTSNGETPLYLASLQGNSDIVLELLKNKADINVRTKSEGLTALSVAAENGHTEIVKILIDHSADVNVRSYHLLTPLHLSALYGHEMSVQVLLAHNASAKIKTHNKWTPLHMAAVEGFASIVKLLLENCVDNIDEKTDEEATALHLAVEHGHKAIVHQLLKYKANMKMGGANGLTPIELATQKEFDDITEMLLKRNLI